MKPHQIAFLLSGLLAAGLAVGTWAQHRQVTDLRATLQAPPPASNDSRPVARIVADAPPLTAPLTDAEHRELLALRRDVGQLRQQKPDLDRLRSENQRLKAAVDHSSALDPAGNPGVSPYLTASTARFTGAATPEDTLQSFLFAARHRDTNALFQVLASLSVAKVLWDIEHQGAEAALQDLGRIPGFRIKEVTEMPDGTAEAEIQFDPRSDAMTEKMRLERVNGQWKLSL